MEYIEGGELFDYIIKKIRVSDRDAAKFFLSLISGVKYIHKLNVVHRYILKIIEIRDLKPENLLLDQNLNIKIVDFGLSNIY
jgi:serine/threonine protein kinase